MSHRLLDHDLGGTCNTGNEHDLDIEEPTVNIYIFKYICL